MMKYYMRLSKKYLICITNLIIANVKRRKYLLGFICSVLLVIVAVALKMGILCFNIHPKDHLDRVCFAAEHGGALGDLCIPLCFKDRLTNITCRAHHMEKTMVFGGAFQNTSYIFKVPKETTYTLHSNHIDEFEFLKSVKEIAKYRFNVTLNTTTAVRLTQMRYDPDYMLYNRKTEKLNTWNLILDNEYLAMALYEQYDVFPKLFGACGTMYYAEMLNPIGDYTHYFSMQDDIHYFRLCVKIALMILRYLQEIEKLPEPVNFCEVKLNNFGLTMDIKKIKYLDLDSVHPRGVINQMLANWSPCVDHSDCDKHDCRSFCNQVTKKCQYGLANNNLQIVCEKIFLGWMLSKKVMVPGLLVSIHAPDQLMDLLENCANPAHETTMPRAKASQEIYNRLYTMLEHIFQTV